MRKELGVKKKEISTGLLISLPIELTEGQLLKIKTFFNDKGWKTKNVRDYLQVFDTSGNSLILRDKECIISGSNAEEIAKEFEEKYRETLDRSLVFLKVARENLSSSRYNFYHRRYRASVTDSYYAVYNGLRAFTAVYKTEKEAEGFPHPTLKTPEVEVPEKALWDERDREKWRHLIKEMLEELDKKKLNNNEKELYDKIKSILHKYNTSINVNNIDEIAQAFESIVTENIYWLRLRADYRVDFEAIVSTKSITNSIFISHVLVSIVEKILQEKEFKFSRIIDSPVVDYVFEPTKKILACGKIWCWDFDKTILITNLAQRKSDYYSINPDKPEQAVITERLKDHLLEITFEDDGVFAIQDITEDISDMSGTAKTINEMSNWILPLPPLKHSIFRDLKKEPENRQSLIIKSDIGKGQSWSKFLNVIRLLGRDSSQLDDIIEDINQNGENLTFFTFMYLS